MGLHSARHASYDETVVRTERNRILFVDPTVAFSNITFIDAQPQEKLASFLKNFLELLQFMESDSSVGLLGVRQVTFNGPPYAAARTFPRPIHILLRRLAFIQAIQDCTILRKHHISHVSQDPMTVDYLIGAFQLIPRRVISRIGLLDEKMF